jgi:hypothetical protein
VFGSNSELRAVTAAYASNYKVTLVDAHAYRLVILIGTEKVYRNLKLASNLSFKFFSPRQIALISSINKLFYYSHKSVPYTH